MGYQAGYLDEWGEYCEPYTEKSGKIAVNNRKRGKRFKLKAFTPIQKEKGVMFFLHDKGYKDAGEAHKIIREFCSFARIECDKIRDCCVAIQDNFKIFLNWFNEKYTRD